MYPNAKSPQCLHKICSKPSLKKKRKENAQKGPKNMLKGLPKRKCSKKHLKTKQIKKMKKRKTKQAIKNSIKKETKNTQFMATTPKKKMKKRNKN